MTQRDVRYCYDCKITLPTNAEYNKHGRTTHPNDWNDWWSRDLDDCPICKHTMLELDIGQHIEIHHKHWERVPDAEESVTLAALGRVTSSNYVLLGLTAGLLVGAYITDWMRSK